MAEYKIVRYHHWLSGHEFQQTLGGNGIQRSLACSSTWGRKESDMTQQLNKKEHVLGNVRVIHYPHFLLSSLPPISPQMPWARALDSLQTLTRNDILIQHSNTVFLCYYSLLIAGTRLHLAQGLLLLRKGPGGHRCGWVSWLLLNDPAWGEMPLHCWSRRGRGRREEETGIDRD